jgi:hypothetical protein
LTKSTHSFARKGRNLLAALIVALAGNMFFISLARAEDVAPPAEVTTIVTQGGDDVSYHIPLTVSVVYDGVTYENVYATTNSVITFGRPDGTYWTYPTTPSVSIESKDWWVLPQQMPDTHFIINVSEGGFQVDGSYRPYGTLTGDTTSIIITAQIQTDGTVAYSYAVDGPLSGNERTGAVLTDGTIVPLSEVNIIEVEIPPVLEPEPVPPTPEPEPIVPEPVVPVEPIDPVVPQVCPPLCGPNEPPPPHGDPRPPIIIDPIIIPEEPPAPAPELPAEEPPTPVEEPPVEEPPAEEPPVPVEEPPAPEEEPPTEAEEPPVEAEPAPEEAPGPTVEEEVLQAEDVEASELPVDTPIELANGVVLTAGVVAALELFDNPAELLSEVFTNPAQVLTALSNIGADMSEDERQESTETILAAVIVGQIATQSAVAAAASAAAASSTYRRKP